MQQIEKIVNMTDLKRKALSFPDPVKSLILSESDSLPFSEFVSKLGTWERLLQMH